MESTAYRVVSLQVAIALFSAVLCYFLFGSTVAKSAFFGGFVAFISSYFQLKKVRNAEQAAQVSPQRSLGILYMSAATRFLLTIFLFALAFGVFKLKPVPALAVFAIAQLAYGWALWKSYKDLL